MKKKKPIKTQKNNIIKEYVIKCPNCSHVGLLVSEEEETSDGVLWYNCKECKFDLGISHNKTDILKITYIFPNDRKEIIDYENRKKYIIKENSIIEEKIF